jgi:hypothetical protein
MSGHSHQREPLFSNGSNTAHEMRKQRLGTKRRKKSSIVVSAAAWSYVLGNLKDEEEEEEEEEKEKERNKGKIKRTGSISERAWDLGSVLCYYTKVMYPSYVHLSFNPT